MLHFDFVTLLPALLQVEDRMSMAHGIESRTPFLDHPLVEFAATIPANVKFKDGELKRLPKVFSNLLPASILNRPDKMGFPVPLVDWLKGELKPMVQEMLSSPSAAGQEFLNHAEIVKALADEKQFGRKIWGFLCLESFCRQFIDGHVAFESASDAAFQIEHGSPRPAAAWAAGQEKLGILPPIKEPPCPRLPS